MDFDFRMWNNHSKTYLLNVNSTLECLKQQILFELEDELGYDHEKEGAVFERNVGICDFKQKKLFEGDIIQWHYFAGNNFTAEVVYLDHTNIADLDSDIRVVGFWLRFKDGGVTSFPEKCDFEIIGNINQTPELIS